MGSDNGSSNNGGFGPSDGSWGPQNPDANGVSQYGGNYVDGRVQVGSPSEAMAPGETPGHFDFRNVQATPATPYATQYENGYATGPGVNSSTSSRQNSLADGLAAEHGGGFFGDLGRGLMGGLGFHNSLGTTPDYTTVGKTSWNPGSLLGLASSLPGMGALGQYGWETAGLPQPSALHSVSPATPTTLSEQIANSGRR